VGRAGGRKTGRLHLLKQGTKKKLVSSLNREKNAPPVTVQGKGKKEVADDQKGPRLVLRRSRWRKGTPQRSVGTEGLFFRKGGMKNVTDWETSLSGQAGGGGS